MRDQGDPPLAVPGEPTDGEVFAIAAEDPGRVAVIFDRHARELLGFLTRRVGPAEAEDFLGDVFVVVVQRRAAFDVDAVDARPWLYGIAANLLHKRRRREARHLRAIARVSRDQGLRILDDRADSTVESRLDAERGSAAMSAAPARLSARDREVLLLVAWAELTQSEIARALDIPVGTVKSRLHRARRQLRASLHIEEQRPGAPATVRGDISHG